jgi:hypothetical protein
MFEVYSNSNFFILKPKESLNINELSFLKENKFKYITNLGYIKPIYEFNVFSELKSKGIEYLESQFETVNYEEIKNLYERFIEHNKKYMLKEYQIEGTQFLVNHFFSYLGDSLGLGKTLQVIMACKYFYEKDPNNKFLFIVTKSKIKDFEKEIETAMFDHENYKDNFIVTNYQQFITKNSEKLISNEYKIIICDEATNLRNPTKFRRGIMKLKSERFILISGTAIEKHPIDLFYQINTFTNYFDYNYFMRTFVNYYKVFNHIQISGFKNLEKLRELVMPFYISRKKEDLEEVDFPNVETMYEYSKVSEEQLKKINDLLIITNDLNNVDYAVAIDLFVKIRLILNETEYNKFNDLEKIVDSYKDEKIVIFTSYKITAESIYEKLKTNRKLFLITGETTKRKEIIDEFEKTKNGILISTDVLAFGISLPNTKIIINYDVPLIASHLTQRIGRLSRLTSNNTSIKNYILLTDSKFDRHILKIVLTKIKYNEKIFDNKENIGLSKEEIVDLLKNYK